MIMHNLYIYYIKIEAWHLILLICYIYIEQYLYYFLYECSIGQMPINVETTASQSELFDIMIYIKQAYSYLEKIINTWEILSYKSSAYT